MQIEFTIPGPPKGKGRPRFAKVGAFVKTYTPKETTSYENLVRGEFRRVHCGPPAEGPVMISIGAYFPVPKSWSKKRLAAHEGKPEPVITKPDIDNIVKIICDSLNQIAYRDDSQVFQVTARKYYSVIPETVVTLSVQDAAAN